VCTYPNSLEATTAVEYTEMQLLAPEAL
jgi:hypothetical protein